MLIKPSSVPQSGDNHLSRLPVARKLERRNPEGSAGSFIPSLFGLAPNGVYLANRLLDCWCALTAPFHPYRLKAGGSHFCGTFPEVTLAGRYPAFCPMELGLSSSASHGNRDYLLHSYPDKFITTKGSRQVYKYKYLCNILLNSHAPSTASLSNWFMIASISSA